MMMATICGTKMANGVRAIFRFGWDLSLVGTTLGENRL